jgi:hypothetical protein
MVNVVELTVRKSTRGLGEGSMLRAHQDDEETVELEAMALGLAGMRQGFELAPIGTAAWHVYRALIPDFERRVQLLQGFGPTSH